MVINGLHSASFINSALNMNRILLSSLLFLSLSSCNAYVTSPGALPAHRQVKWLKKMTVDICDAKPGELSHLQLSEAPELINAWSHVHQKNGKESALAVESLVKRLIDERRAGNAQAGVDVQDYNCLLQAWATSGQGTAAAERCEQILEGMQEIGPTPDLDSFKCTLMAWRQAGPTGGNPYRAQRVLEWMIRLYRDGENKQALPDADCFDIVMQIWSRSGHPKAPEQTEQILGAMEKLYRSTGLKKLKPRHASFNAVLAAWSKSGRTEAADRAISILSFMELLASNGDTTIAPDPASYNTVMGAFARCQKQKGCAARKADAILQHAESAYAKDPTNFALDTILFNTAIGAWSKSDKTAAFVKARAILDRQQAIYQGGCETAKPDVVGFTSVIASCASEPGSKEIRAKAFQVALKTFQELKTVDQPNHITYGLMLKACARLLPATARQQLVRDIFTECVANGCVGDLAVSRLHEASPELYKELMAGHKRGLLPE